MNFIVPDWPAPQNIHALQTTRCGGQSQAPYDTFNLGDHVGDDPQVVSVNRNQLNAFLPSEPIWMQQVHGRKVIVAETAGHTPVADACVSMRANAVCAIMTADCLPVLLCDEAGTVVAAVHAGWRGLADGVIEATVSDMGVPEETLMAWLGPAIGPQAFEVGGEVREVFVQHDPEAGAAFICFNSAGDADVTGEKYRADIYMLARQRLRKLGVNQIYGGEYCTHTDHERFFSYRRDGQTGRMATLIWLG